MLMTFRGLPKAIVCDNGPDFRGEALGEWADRCGVAQVGRALIRDADMESSSKEILELELLVGVDTCESTIASIGLSMIKTFSCSTI